VDEAEHVHAPDLRLVARTLAPVRPLERAKAAFHQINSLLPDEQDVVTVDAGCFIQEALALMDHYGFSQLPVIAGTEVLGVISYRSIARALAGNAALTRTRIEELSVEDLVEEFHFARPSDELDTVLERLDQDGAILVGDPSRLMAVAASTDFIRFFHEIARPFVLIQEIEISLRACIEQCASQQDVVSAIRSAKLGRFRDCDEGRMSLDQLTLTEQIDIVKNGDNYSRYFQKLFGRSRPLTMQKLVPVATIRNDLFHFRRAPTPTDLSTLASSRGWLFRKVRAATAGTIV
jgi:predicted transcriptional regulator